jgi:hypothetical protein
MENMRSRIDRGDIKLERAEAIKVRALERTDRLFKLIHVALRQCVISLQTAQPNSNHRYACICSVPCSPSHARNPNNFVAPCDAMQYAMNEMIVMNASCHESYHDSHEVTISLALLLSQ